MPGQVTSPICQQCIFPRVPPNAACAALGWLESSVDRATAVAPSRCQSGRVVPIADYRPHCSDNERPNRDPLCISVFGLVEQVDGRKTKPSESVDVVPGRHDLVIAGADYVAGILPGTIAGQVWRRRFSVDFEPNHTYRAYVRWRSCSLFMNPTPDDLEINVYDVGTHTSFRRKSRTPPRDGRGGSLG